MATKMFVNLPVKDLKISMDFFTGLGFSFNPTFTDETAAYMIVSEENYVMLLTYPKFSEFTGKEISDAQNSTEVIIALSADNKEAVDEMADKAISSGGSESGPARDYGFMYQRSFQDPDGHMWEVLYMDMSKVNW
jgi:predicted lactoylglutathione lyase